MSGAGGRPRRPLHTVSTDLRSVYRKLDISSRAQLPAHFAGSRPPAGA